jgi:hypothetical protein
MENVSLNSVGVLNLEGSDKRRMQQRIERRRTQLRTQLKRILEELAKDGDPTAEKMLVDYALKWLEFKDIIPRTQYIVLRRRMLEK